MQSSCGQRLRIGQESWLQTVAKMFWTESPKQETLKCNPGHTVWLCPINVKYSAIFHCTMCSGLFDFGGTEPLCSSRKFNGWRSLAQKTQIEKVLSFLEFRFPIARKTLFWAKPVLGLIDSASQPKLRHGQPGNPGEIEGCLLCSCYTNDRYRVQNVFQWNQRWHCLTDIHWR